MQDGASPHLLLKACNTLKSKFLNDQINGLGIPWPLKSHNLVN